MTKITNEDVRKVALLARLELKDDQVDLYTRQLEKILNYVEQLQKVDTNNVEPTTRAVEVVNVLREDFVEETDVREQLLNLSPQREGDFFRVPKIMNE